MPSFASRYVYFNYSGIPKSYRIPYGITSIVATVKGAAGGSFLSQTGGRGASLTLKISVNPGDLLRINVGGIGKQSGGQNVYCLRTYMFACSGGGAGGYNGGQDGCRSNNRGGSGGGGRSDISISGNYLAVAAGGGGASSLGNGGDGGTGADVLCDTDNVYGGGGGGGYSQGSFGSQGGSGGSNYIYDNAAVLLLYSSASQMGYGMVVLEIFKYPTPAPSPRPTPGTINIVLKKSALVYLHFFFLIAWCLIFRSDKAD